MASAIVLPDVVGPAGTETIGGSSEQPGVLPAQQENGRAIRVEVLTNEPYNALPSDLLFGALRHPALRLIQPIPLRTEHSQDGISVVWDAVQEFGFGETFSDAIQDFSDTIAELYL